MESSRQAKKGAIQGDHIKLLEPVDLADGAIVELTITVPIHIQEARDRQRNLMREDLHLGETPYPSREEMYER
jgi:predicted DNA-binding antitoxin AbrB/MazE fold protein